AGKWPASPHRNHARRPPHRSAGTSLRSPREMHRKPRATSRTLSPDRPRRKLSRSLQQGTQSLPRKGSRTRPPLRAKIMVGVATTNAFFVTALRAFGVVGVSADIDARPVRESSCGVRRLAAAVCHPGSPGRAATVRSQAGRSIQSAVILSEARVFFLPFAGGFCRRTPARAVEESLFDVTPAAIEPRRAPLNFRFCSRPYGAKKSNSLGSGCASRLHAARRKSLCPRRRKNHSPYRQTSENGNR